MLYLIVDLEATCWNIEERKRHLKDQEIIEIGCTIVNEEFDVISSNYFYVRPEKNPVLSEFCMNLTHIKQEDIDDALDFSTVILNIKDWAYKNINLPSEEIIWCSWGEFDKNLLELECDRNNLKFPFGSHINLKVSFDNYLRKNKLTKNGEKTKVGISTALKYLHLDFSGTPHRALDDTLNIVKICKGRVILSNELKFGDV